MYRHPVVVRITQWVDAVCLLALRTSGLRIFNAHPALYWCNVSTFDSQITRRGHTASRPGAPDRAVETGRSDSRETRSARIRLRSEPPPMTKRRVCAGTRRPGGMTASTRQRASRSGGSTCSRRALGEGRRFDPRGPSPAPRRSALRPVGDTARALTASRDAPARRRGMRQVSAARSHPGPSGDGGARPGEAARPKHSTSLRPRAIPGTSTARRRDGRP